MARARHTTPVNDAFASMLRRDLAAEPLGGFRGEMAARPREPAPPPPAPAFVMPEWDGSSFVDGALPGQSRSDEPEAEPEAEQRDLAPAAVSAPPRPVIPPPDWEFGWAREQVVAADRKDRT